MIIEWLKENHTITRGFGQNISGLTHKHERPDKITISFDEMLTFWDIRHILLYLKQVILTTKERKIEITWE